MAPAPPTERAMTDLLTAKELDLFRNIPEVDLVELAIELDVPVGEEIDRPALLNASVRGLAQLARREGLPFSEYDREDLDALPREERDALARLCGTAPSLDSLDALLKSGRKVYRSYTRNRPKSQVPLFLPMLLTSLARYAASADGQRAP